MRFNIDIYADNLMMSVDELQEKGISQQVIQRIVRLRDIYNYMLRNPLKKDREYIDYVQANYRDADDKPISKRKAYEDLEILHAIVGNLQQCSKEWHRWRFNNMIMEGYTVALRKQDASAIARLAQQYGKFNQLDKIDEHDRNYGDIPRINFTFDPTSLGFKRIPDLRKVIDELVSKYSKSVFEDVAEDVDVVEMTDAITEKEKQINQFVKQHDET